MSAAFDIDDSMADGLMSGTFRWGKKKRFHPLPKFPSTFVEVEKGWGAYLRTRDPSGGLTSVAQRDSSLLDCLTFPISVAYWIKKLGPSWGWSGKGKKELNVVVLGATSKAEERVLRETRCWQELGLLLPDTTLHLSMIGPEVSAYSDSPDVHAPLPPNLHIKLRKMDPPCAKRVLTEDKERLSLLPAAHTLFVTFNGGFGNFVDSGHLGLLWSWVPDLQALSESGAACLFFCANDYADVKGETAIQANLIGSRFLVPPQLNPYHAGSTFQGEGDGSWFCANHSAYITCGFDPARRFTLGPGASAKERKRNEEKVMRAVAGLEKLDWKQLLADRKSVV